MEWLVIDVIYIKSTKHHILTLHAASLKMVAEVLTEFPLNTGDVLYPVRDAEYLINKKEFQRLKFLSASSFSVTLWNSLKKLKNINKYNSTLALHL
ncbi:polymyxin B resistance protein pmrD [Salmonella enterica]|nr:polymyxin B resistance protein pmrD [Salmonella enterica]ECS6156322.1 polymyxin B resistance protein pmrD [Salmonella enterica subsp. enterica serovar Javiana]EBR7649352.1 polymyxin B resistance protein pmrD [Salmonella enterica]EEC5487951.1 polymyxin B resistance protein pmrD [Salmonella enterica]EEF7969073.1 polymyxin B resistance protein pmrD [Salmonella enterica]